MRNEKILNFPLIMLKNKMRIKWNSKISGIYAWVNEINGKIYIGQTVNFYKRIYYEMNGFRNNKHQNILKLFNAIQKYGINNFRVVKLLECPKEYLNKIERLLIEYYDTKNNGYNCTFGGEGTGGHKVTQEQIEKQKKKMVEYWTDKRKKQHVEKMKGWFYSQPNNKQNEMRAGNMWWLDKECKERHKENTAKSLTVERIEKQRSSILKYYEENDSEKAIIREMISPSGEIIKMVGLCNFCKKYHLERGGIINVLNGMKKHHRGWHTDPNFTYISPPLKKLKSPDEILYEFKSVIKFCREHGLDLSGIKNVLNKKSKHHKLWRLPETSLEDAMTNNSHIYKNIKFRFPDNHIERVIDKKGFCEKYGFSKKYLYGFLRNKLEGDTFHGLKLISK
jgi:group I intron endonuclease